VAELDGGYQVSLLMQVTKTAAKGRKCQTSS
jgi:hypothetical protein